ncbi:hypothetical protein ACLBKU_09670 [Erythrobacter sp. NE805]|uniref:hypothetical protein n=1 Tax=Erythrobacter sp. NE805 TaxID=3389875 RepID=UPI00396B3C04
MRIGLIAALRRSEEGTLRAELPLAGRPVLAWQAALLGELGVERVLCLTDTPTPTGAVLALQHALEASGTAFHALRGFAAIPALVRAEDDLVILADGLVPDPQVVRAVLGGGEGALVRAVATIPADHPLAAAHPEDFERIDAARHWAGVLAMRGAPAQQLAEMPADADAIGLLLRLALQAGTPTRDLAARELVPESWLLAANAAVAAEAGSGLIARAAPPADWRAPMSALAARLVRAVVPRGLGEGRLIAGASALVLLLAAVLVAAFGPPAAALTLAGLGAFAAEVAAILTALANRLSRTPGDRRGAAALAAAVDVLGGLTLWFALAPWPAWQPLAVVGPLVVGLARLVARRPHGALARAASDRASLLLLLAAASLAGLLPEAAACLALGLLAALLLHRAGD